MMNTTEFVSTREAARMLGLSMTLVQNMLDRKEIQGWRTPGGHRRISVQSLMQYKNTHNVNTLPDRGALGRPVVMLVTESETLEQDWLQDGHTQMCAFDLRWHRSLEAALTEVTRLRPHLILLDLDKPSDDMQRILDRLHEVQRLARSQPITLVTQAWSPIQAKTDLPVVPGPMTRQWLQIFLAGAHASRASLLGEKT